MTINGVTYHEVPTAFEIGQTFRVRDFTHHPPYQSARPSEYHPEVNHDTALCPCEHRAYPQKSGA
jgi:hypothetical protein